MALRRPKKGAKWTDYDRMCSMGYSKPLPSPSNMTILGSFFGSSRLGTPIFYRPQTAAPKERLFQAYVQRTPSFVQAVDLLTSKGGEIHNVTWPWDRPDKHMSRKIQDQYMTMQRITALTNRISYRTWIFHYELRVPEDAPNCLFPDLVRGAFKFEHFLALFATSRWGSYGPSILRGFTRWQGANRTIGLGSGWRFCSGTHRMACFWYWTMAIKG